MINPLQLVEKQTLKHKKYDYLVVGSGLFGAVFAYEANKRGKKVLIVEKRSHIGGNLYTENIHGIDVHKYGAHIFHTSDRAIWQYVNQFTEFNHFVNAPIAKYKDEVYNLPFNMNTFSKMWGVSTPAEAKSIIDNQRREIIGTPRNLEEQAISLVGRDIYEKLIKGYTEKQWGRKARDLPSFIIRRLPVRMVYDNNYFNDTYQGIPTEGYTKMIERMIAGIEVVLNTDFLENREFFSQIAHKIVYTGPIDAYFQYCFGELEYRTLRFETEILPTENYQGNAVVNYTEYDIPYTRIIEHKHFTFGCQKVPVTSNTIITREYPAVWEPGAEPYYPVNNDRNDGLYQKYRDLAKNENNTIFGGRLGMYKYYDMHQIIAVALDCVAQEFKEEEIL